MILLAVIIIALLIIFLLTRNKNSPLFEDDEIYETDEVEKGKKGERWVASLLESLDESKYKILNDVMIRRGNGETSQIDHIVVSVFGIFVIETKNYSGKIFGSEKDEEWTVKLGGKKFSLRNPIKQNWSHIFALKELLFGYGYLKFFPIVVFAGSAEFGRISSSVPIVYDDELLDEIFRSSREKSISQENVARIFDLISNANITNSADKIAHIQNIEKKIMLRQEQSKNNICPRCGGTLKIKNGKFGQFFGCSNFPRCRFTKNLSK